MACRARLATKASPDRGDALAVDVHRGLHGLERLAGPGEPAEAATGP